MSPRERGHRVTLVEKAEALGGQFRLAAAQPERDEIGELLGWYRTRLEKLQVRVELGRELTADAIRDFGADAVVLSTGSVPTRTGFQRALPHVDALPGAKQENVHAANDVLAGTARPGRRVLLLDDLNGWWPASGTALYLAERSHDVTVVTASDKPAEALDLSHLGREHARALRQAGRHGDLQSRADSLGRQHGHDPEPLHGGDAGAGVR